MQAFFGLIYCETVLLVALMISSVMSDTKKAI
jgi:hypothetical protein